MTRILHSYTDVRPLSQIETLHSIIALAKWRGYELHSKKMVVGEDYHNFLLENWGKDDLINIEQDIVVSNKIINDLEFCSYKLCCYPYRLDAGKWSVWKSHSILLPADHYENLPQFAECSSLGLVKISKGIQLRIPLHEYDVGFYKWWFLDTWISEETLKLELRWHVHQPPVVHNRNIAY